MKKLLVTILMVLMTGQAWATEYYVSNKGNDNNNGTSSSTPWAHHPWDNNVTSNVRSIAATTTLKPGDIVYMAKGGTWYNVTLMAKDPGKEGEQITTTSIDGFGTGKNPILTTSLAPNDPSLRWTKKTESIYAAHLKAEAKTVVYRTTQLQPSATHCNAIPKNTFRYALSASKTENCDANTLYVNVGADPSGFLLAARRDYVINNTASYHTFSDITAQVANKSIQHQSGQAAINNNNVLFRWFFSNGADYNEGKGKSSITNSIIYNGSYIKDSEGLHLNMTPDFTLSNSEIYGLKYGVNACSADNFLANNNNIHHNSNGLSYHAGKTEKNGAGLFICGYTSHAVISNNRLTENYINVLHGTTAGTGGNRISNNISTNAVVNSIDIQNDSNEEGAQPQLIYNNTVYHSPSASNVPQYSGHGISIQNRGKNAKIANNNITVGIAGQAENCQGISISGVYDNVQLDYNNVVLINPNYGDIGKLKSDLFNTMTSWKEAVQADSNLAGLDGVQKHAESHSTSDVTIQHIDNYSGSTP